MIGELCPRFAWSIFLPAETVEKGGEILSYTMTIEAPEKAAWFEKRRAMFSPEKLGDLFVTFLKEQTPEVLEEETPRPVSARVHALRGVIRLPEGIDEREFKLERLASRFGG